jgi:hypothetical protein
MSTFKLADDLSCNLNALVDTRPRRPLACCAETAMTLGETPPRDTGAMACRVCGWWPPLVRVRRGQTERASEAWRWRQLFEHVCEVATDEAEDGRQDGPHMTLEEELFRRRTAR